MTTTDHERKLVPVVVETPLDLYFWTPVADLLARAALPTPLRAGGMRLMGVVVGLCGASLLRYPTARQLVPGAILLLLYGILERGGRQLALARGTSSRIGRVADGVSAAVVGIACAAGVAAHLAPDGGDLAVLAAVLGFVSVFLQAALFDYFRNRYLAGSSAGPTAADDLAVTEAKIARGGSASEVLLSRLYALFLRAQRLLGRGAEQDTPTREDAAAYAPKLAPVARAWAYLGPSTHVAAFVVFVCFGGLSAYVWTRVTAGNLAMVLLWIEQHRRERALRPPVVDPFAGPSRAITGPPPAPPLAAPPPAAEVRKETAPISWRPPPMDDSDS